MAAIEHLEVHSRSYIVRWVQVDEGHTLSWSVQPHKKSINFGLVKHPGSGATTLVSSTGEPATSGSSQTHGVTEGKSSRIPKRETTAQDLLANKGFISIKWLGKCEADKVSMGTHDVHAADGGMYGLVFDNTFSKQTSKTATFVVLTYPTDAPPQTVVHLPNLQQSQAHGSQTSLGKHVPHLDGVASASSDSLHSHPAGGRAVSVSGRSEGGGAPSANYHVGNLSKRRRKKGQGYARRFFSLDYSTCTLSYYYNRNSSALRGAIPLSLAAVAADERRREINIDSGAEVWHLRAPNDKEFQEWARALEKASRVARGVETIPQPASKGNVRPDSRPLQPSQPSSREEEAEWHQVEALVSRVVGSRDALRRLTKDIAAQTTTPGSGQHLTPGDDKNEDYFARPAEKKSFWRRKSSAPATTSALSQAASSALAVPSPGSAAAVSVNGSKVSQHKSKGSKSQIHEEKSLQDHCQSLLTDLDSTVSEFAALISSSKRRRQQAPLVAGLASRKSIDTVSTTDEFFDAEDAKSTVMKIDGSEDESESEDDDGASFHDNSSVSSVDDAEGTGSGEAGDLFPAKPRSLIPLPVNDAVRRRVSVPPVTGPPTSVAAIVRKNVGKDLSTISMPVSTNEPLSALQKVAEQLEYAQLLNQAVKQRTPTERLLYVTAFAVSQFSCARAKERAIRKPFTPLLGETYELVRTEQEVPGGFRLLVEKVQHRPLKLAMHADSANWSFTQSPTPGSKFWGRSFEVTTEGRVRIALRLSDGTDEYYSWNIATMFLRNAIVGEKYLEPVGTMHILNDTTGHKAAVEFKSKGMFGGRVEDVQVVTYSPDGSNTGSGLIGTWTNGLRTQGPGKAASDDIWQVGQLVDNAANTYGMTVFAAGLNELTEVEKGKLAPTDSRLRPDQRLTEQGKLDEAEELKVKLEEAQRARRRAMEERDEEHKPKWFFKAGTSPDGEEVWKIKGGKDSYWEERAKGSWGDVEDLFKV